MTVSPRDRVAGKRRGGEATPDFDDAWRRVQLLADTLKPEELRKLSDRDILRRLFAEDDVRIFESSPVFFRCRCSRERVVGMLRGVGSGGDPVGACGARQRRSALRLL